MSQHFLKETVASGVFATWQEVELVVDSFTDLGMDVIINDEYLGVVYRNEIYKSYRRGQSLKGYIKQIREDGRIDVSLQPPKGLHIPSVGERIVEHLKARGGKSSFSDKSSPRDIEDEFQVSKRVFKQAIGSLYKQGVIKIADNGIELL